MEKYEYIFHKNHLFFILEEKLFLVILFIFYYRKDRKKNVNS